MLPVGRYRVTRRMEGRMWQGFAEVVADGEGVAVREEGHWQTDGAVLGSRQEWWLGEGLLRLKTPAGGSHDYALVGGEGSYVCGPDVYGVALEETPDGMKMRHWVAGPSKTWQQVVEYARSEEMA